MRFIRDESLDRPVSFGEWALRRAVCEYIKRYHAVGNQYGFGNRLLEPMLAIGSPNNPIQQRERLRGMLNLYYGTEV